MATNRNLLKEAIADAKAVKETAIANAKMALEESFAPYLKEKLSAKLAEMDEEDEIQREAEMKTEEAKKQGYNDKLDDAEGAKHGKKEQDMAQRRADSENMEKADGKRKFAGDSKMDEADDAEGYEGQMGKRKLGTKEVDEAEDIDEMDLDELLAELDKELNEDARTDAEEEGYLDGMKDEKEDEEDKDEDEEIDLEDMSEDDLKSFIEDVIADMVKAGELEGEMEADEEDEDLEGDEESDDDVEIEVEDEEEITMDENARTDAEEEGYKDGMEDEKEDLKHMREEVETLKAELMEVNMLNAKLLYVNKIFRGKNLSESQKAKVLAAFDKATTVTEVKLVFETLSEGLSPVKSVIKENLGRASKAMGNAPKKQMIMEVDSQVARWQKLAGIK